MYIYAKHWDWSTHRKSLPLVSPGKILEWTPDLPSVTTQLYLLSHSIPLEGKKQVCQFNVIPILVELLNDKVKEVQANAAGVLMFATVITEGEIVYCPGRYRWEVNNVGGHLCYPQRSLKLLLCWLPQELSKRWVLCSASKGYPPPCTIKILMRTGWSYFKFIS